MQYILIQRIFKVETYKTKKYKKRRSKFKRRFHRISVPFEINNKSTSEQIPKNRFFVTEEATA